jgi:hypothetical protein
MGVEGSIREECQGAAAGGKRLVASGGEVYNRPPIVSMNPASGLGFLPVRWIFNDDSTKEGSCNERIWNWGCEATGGLSVRIRGTIRPNYQN